MKFASSLQLFIVGVLFVLSVSASLGDSSTPRRRILIVKSRDIAFYNPTVQGFIDGLQSRGYYSSDSADLKIIALTGDAGKDQQTVKDQLAKTNSIVFTLGTDATLAVQAVGTSAPCLFTMVLDPVNMGVVKSLSEPGDNFTGTTLLVDPGKQLEEFQQVAPQVKRIGVLYTDGDATSQAFLATASQEAEGLGIQIVAMPISDYSSNGQQTVTQLATKVDAFWLIVDPSSVGPQELADTIEIAKKRNLPVLGMSSANVRSGALLSLSPNLRDLGDVDAEMACPLLDGTTKADEMPVRRPRQTMLSINLITAKQLGITLPVSVLHLADEVIDGSQPTPGN